MSALPGLGMGVGPSSRTPVAFGMGLSLIVNYVYAGLGRLALAAEENLLGVRTT